MKVEDLDDNYWSSRYQQQQTGWDVGHISTPLKEYIDQLSDKDISILIPGCGNAYEAAYLLQHGFTNITLIDISEVLVNDLKKQFEETPVKIKHEDFFKHHQQYQLIIEQTFFCAIHPKLRKNYVQKMYDLLQKNGKLAGLLFDKDFESGPPFGGSKAEYEKLFSEKFNIKTMATAYNSIKPRAGAELFFIAEKKS